MDYCTTTLKPCLGEGTNTVTYGGMVGFIQYQDALGQVFREECLIFLEPPGNCLLSCDQSPLNWIDCPDMCSELGTTALTDLEPLLCPYHYIAQHRNPPRYTFRGGQYVQVIRVNESIGNLALWRYYDSRHKLPCIEYPFH